MDVDALHPYNAGSGVETLVFQLAQGAAVHRVGKVRSEARDIKPIRPAADLFVRRKGDADLSVVRRVRRQHPLAQGHDFRYAGLVVCAKD